MASKKSIPNNIYTVLLGFSFLALAAACTFVYMKADELRILPQMFG